MASLKSLFAGIGVETSGKNVSIQRQLFGFRANQIPRDPEGGPTCVSYDISKPSQATELYRAVSVDNDGIDVFILRNISGDFLGISPLRGSVKVQNVASDTDGLIGGHINRSDSLGIARTFCHEICHFLGLSHVDGKMNLMTQTKNVSSTRDSVRLTGSPSDTINGHRGYIRDAIA